MNSQDFQLTTGIGETMTINGSIPVTPRGMTEYRSSPSCIRYFCSICGAHVFIRYDSSQASDAAEVIDDCPVAALPPSPWAGEIHFPTALLDTQSVQLLEQVLKLITVYLLISLFYGSYFSF